jgi:hypothetical protein
LKGVIDLKDQYTKRTKEYMEECQTKNPNVQFLSDGLTVSNIVIFYIFTTFFFSLQQKQCQAYQVACQSLGAVLPLHLRQDKTRHDGNSTIVYEKEKKDPDSEVNLDAYEPDLHVEQGGVAHLVHGWIQQNIESRVFFIHLPCMTYSLIALLLLLLGAFHIW